MSFSGRRPSDRSETAKTRAKRVGMGLLDGLAYVGTALSDGPKFERIKEIDAEIDRLKHERDTLISGLIEPGDLKVSEDYDPNKAVFIHPARPGEGRLVQCKGRATRSAFHDAHPGCPYVEQIHNKHEFTLRD